MAGRNETVTRWYEPHLDRLYEDAPVRQGDLVQLRQIAATYTSRERFLTEMTLDPPAATSDGPAPRRGRRLPDPVDDPFGKRAGVEVRAVLNVVDGCIPSDMSTGTTEEIEEERRLLYVAMTRAKDDLQLMLPQRFYVHQQAAYGDRHVYASRSRFIPDALTAFFERCCWPAATPSIDGNHAKHGAAPPVDIAARIRGLWR